MRKCSNLKFWERKWRCEVVWFCIINEQGLFVQGTLATAATFCLIYWAISIKGPTYPTMFNPLALIFVAISEAILLGQPISLGMYEWMLFLQSHDIYASVKVSNEKLKLICSLVGMLLILTGLYSFLWGKEKETESMVEACGEVSTGMARESLGVHSTAMVVPSISPANEKTDRNWKI